MDKELISSHSEKQNIISIVQIKLIVIFVIFINFCTLFFSPLVNSNSRMYANIAKHMVVNNNWIDLMYRGTDWLDKPHFPFWMTALSFKFFGINTFSYVLPGFIFNLIGAFFTYKIAYKIYNKNVAWLACLIYLTVLRLMIGTIAVRAEAFLVGEIMAACYYWLMYNTNAKFKYLLKGSFFTALVIMTKGLFLTIPIISGFIAIWIYKKEWKNFFHLKWIAALFVTFIFITPELMALYLQFDSHPEKVLFGQNNVSGIKFFFWDSQFGRIFNFGPISEGRGYPLFFVHTFFWAFLPWCLVFVAAIYKKIKCFKSETETNKINLVFLLSSFFVTFALFSMTKFQRDYYTDVVFPFAAILCSHFLTLKNEKLQIPIYYVQIILSFIITIISFASFVFITVGNIYSYFIILPILLVIYLVKSRKQNLCMKAIIYPCLSVTVAFICLHVAIWHSYEKFDPGYKVNHFLAKQENRPLYIFKVSDESTGLYFYSKFPSFWINSLDEIKGTKDDFYIVTQKNFVAEIKNKIPNAKIINNIDGFQTASFFPLLKQNFKQKYNTNLSVLKVNF